ncbi:hypothetical protein GOBAR_DD13716 [Gossypium barbadense]|nr:hypothetical protein GOBAR_DD13716 [Gossypium barbadense]
MGCSSSKLDDLPAVSLCRERCSFLDEAIQQRFALAEAHVAYFASLKLFGQSLNSFIEYDPEASLEAPPPPSPPSDKDKAVDQDDSGASLHHSGHSSPLHDGGGGGHIEYIHQNYPNYGGFESGSFPNGFMHMNFMKKQPMPSIVYEQRPMNPETVYMGESSSPSSYYPYFNDNPSSYLNPGYRNYGGFSNYSSYPAPGYDSSLQQPSTAAVGASPVEAEDGKVASNEAEAARQSDGMENERVEYEVHVVDKKVVDNERAEECGNGSGTVPRNAFEVAKEIEVQFVRASESANEIAKLLEVGTLHYQHKHGSKMLLLVQPSLTYNTDPALLDFDEELARKPKSLSSTLQKLYLWEKKLYNEAEEKIRVAYDKKSRKLKRLDERGAEATKVDSTRNIIRSLSTKLRIAIQVVDKISVTINKIRDDELWPLLNELIDGLSRMWKCMLKCHRNQYEVIREAKALGSIGSRKMLSDDHLTATLQLEHELINWALRFSRWIGAQKGYVRALNNWLLKCLYYEPEVTDDGIAPFSPSRVGAPPIFVICNQWSQTMDRISEREVVNSMRIFAMSLFQLWEHDKSEMHRRMMTNKDLERRGMNLDREDQKLQKEIQALDKQMVLVSGDGNSLSVSGHVVYQSETSSGNLQGSLQRIFEAMEKFSSESSKAYEELLQRVEERTGQERERVS